MSGDGMLGGYSSSWAISTAAIGTAAIDDVLRTIFHTHYLSNAIFRYIHDRTHVPIQLGQNSKFSNDIHSSPMRDSHIQFTDWFLFFRLLLSFPCFRFFGGCLFTRRQNTYLYLCVGLLLLISSTLILHMVLFAEAFVWVPKYTKDTLFISAVSAYDSIYSNTGSTLPYWFWQYAKSRQLILLSFSSFVPIRFSDDRLCVHRGGIDSIVVGIFYDIEISSSALRRWGRSIPGTRSWTQPDEYAHQLRWCTTE